MTACLRGKTLVFDGKGNSPEIPRYRDWQVSRINPIRFEGVHGPLPGLKAKGWKGNGIPSWIAKNSGCPPLLLNCGDPERVAKIGELLEDRAILSTGRGNVAIGIAEYEGKKFPIMAFSTGMGEASAEIMAKETLAHVSLEPKYFFDGKALITGGIIVLIRLGTCGGCNYSHKSGKILEPVVDRPALINATNNLTTGGTIMESMGYPPSVLGMSKNHSLRKQFETDWAAYGGKVVRVKDWPLIQNKNDESLRIAISKAAGELCVPCHEGGTLSKASLNFEQSSGRLFEHLRKKHDNKASEMEQATMAYLASKYSREHGLDIRTGMVALVVGALPGTGYPEAGNQEHENQIVTGMENMLKVAIAALSNFAGIEERK